MTKVVENCLVACAFTNCPISLFLVDHMKYEISYVVRMICYRMQLISVRICEKRNYNLKKWKFGELRKKEYARILHVQRKQTFDFEIRSCTMHSCPIMRFVYRFSVALLNFASGRFFESIQKRSLF